MEHFLFLRHALNRCSFRENRVWSWLFLKYFLKDQSTRKKTMNKLYIRQVHEKWSIFCFYGIFWIVVVFEIIALEIFNLCTYFRCNTQTFLNFLRKNQFLQRFLNFHKMNIVAIFIAKWDEQNGTKFIQFEHCFGLLKRKHEPEFSFQ